MTSAKLFTVSTRSERFYTALLLPHLLMSDGFRAMRKLFEHLGLNSHRDSEILDLEIVAEMNPLRQLGEPIDTDVGEEDGPSERKPDLVLRLGNCVLVIEAKFFTFPPVRKIVDQMQEQRKAIESVIGGTEYAEYEFHYLALTVNPLDFSEIFDASFSHMTWRALASVLEPAGLTECSSDVKYALDTLSRAIELADTESNKQSTIEVHWERVNSMDELFRRTPELLYDGYRYVGIDRYVKKLEDMTLADMETRREYKYSKKQGKNARNWPPLTAVVSRYLTLKQEASENSASVIDD